MHGVFGKGCPGGEERAARRGRRKALSKAAALGRLGLIPGPSRRVPSELAPLQAGAVLPRAQGSAEGDRDTCEGSSPSLGLGGLWLGAGVSGSLGREAQWWPPRAWHPGLQEPVEGRVVGCPSPCVGRSLFLASAPWGTLPHLARRV